MSIGLESLGFHYAKYDLNKNIYKIYSEPNYKDFTIQLMDCNNNLFTVKLCDVKLIKSK